MTFPSEHDFALFLFQLFILVALVITATVTSAMSGPLIRWALGQTAAVREQVLPVGQ